MKQSSGQIDATICSKFCNNLESSQRHADTAGQSASRMTERNSANATHAVLPRRLHACAAGPPSSENKVGSTNVTIDTPTIRFEFREHCPVISASCATLFLALPRRRTSGEEIDRFRVLAGRNSSRVSSLWTFPVSRLCSGRMMRNAEVITDHPWPRNVVAAAKQFTRPLSALAKHNP